MTEWPDGPEFDRLRNATAAIDALRALGLTHKASRILYHFAGVSDLSGLSKITSRDLLAIPGLGRKSVESVVSVLAENGVALEPGASPEVRRAALERQIKAHQTGLSNARRGLRELGV